MSPLLLIVIVLLILLAVSGGWGYRAGWYGPAAYPGFGIIGVILVVVLILLLLGRL